MKITRLIIVVGCSLAAGGMGWLFLWGKARTAMSASLQAQKARQQSLVREVAQSLEEMAKEGKALPVPDPAHLAAAQKEADELARAKAVTWDEYVSKRHIEDYRADLAGRADTGPESLALQRLVILNRFGTSEFAGDAERFAQESLEQLKQRPGEAFQAVSHLLDGLPAERSQERAYLVQLASRLDNDDSEVHGKLVSILREEVSRGMEQAPEEGSAADEARARVGSRATATAAIIELSAMGEPLPEEISRIATQDQAALEALRDSTRAVASSPQRAPGSDEPAGGLPQPAFPVQEFAEPAPFAVPPATEASRSDALLPGSGEPMPEDGP